MDKHKAHILLVPELFDYPFNHVAFTELMKAAFEDLANRMPLRNFCDDGVPHRAVVIKLAIASGAHGEGVVGNVVYEFEESKKGQFLNHFKRACLAFTYHLPSGVLLVRCRDEKEMV